MARKPVDLVQGGRKPSTRQAIWQAIRANRDGFTLPVIVGIVKCPYDTARTYLKALHLGDFIHAVGTEPFVKPGIIARVSGSGMPVIVYRLVRDVGVEAPRLTRDGKPVLQGLGQEQMWRAMRMMQGDWNSQDLAVAASTDDVTINEQEAARYIGHLFGAAYLQMTAKNNGPKSKARYRLVKNTGPKAPMIQRLKTVFDPNLGQVVWQEEVDE
jgi:hypothetical protein